MFTERFSREADPDSRASDVAKNPGGARTPAEVSRSRRLEPGVLLDAGTPVLDIRDADAYGAGHVAKSLNIGIGLPEFSTWAGLFVDPHQPVVLVAESGEDADRAWLELARIGYENLRGCLEADVEAWRAAGLDVRTTRQMGVCCLESWLRDGGLLLDVRTLSEWRGGHIDAATWIPLPALLTRLEEVPPGPLPVICGTGHSSSLATSLLERAGRRHMANVRGGWSAWSRGPQPRSSRRAGP